MKAKRAPQKAKKAASPALPTQSGSWVRLSAGDEAVTAGGGRRSVYTEIMALPGNHGWVMRTMVVTGEGGTSVALCHIPKR